VLIALKAVFWELRAAKKVEKTHWKKANARAKGTD